MSRCSEEIWKYSHGCGPQGRQASADETDIEFTSAPRSGAGVVVGKVFAGCEIDEAVEANNADNTCKSTHRKDNNKNKLFLVWKVEFP